MNDLDTESIKPFVLVILDGWGIAPPAPGNAVAKAKTPTIDNLIKTYPAMTLAAAGEAVGLSKGEPGNAEVGHLNIGAGRVVYNNLSQIDRAILDGSFFDNETFLKTIKRLKKDRASLHLVGLISDDNRHSSLNHLLSLLDLCRQNNFKRVFIHAILGGDNSDRHSTKDGLERLQTKITAINLGKIATVSGRRYAMDQDHHWERITLAYKAIAEAKSDFKFNDPNELIEAAHEQKLNDQEIIPAVSRDFKGIKTNDSVWFFNFCGLGMRELLPVFVLPSFAKVAKEPLVGVDYLTMTEYDKTLPVEVAFPNLIINNTLGQVIADNNLSQLRIAETERYVHITKYFAGGQIGELDQLDSIAIPALKMRSYVDNPEMSIKEVTKVAVDGIIKGQYHFLVVNYANVDVLAHQGNLPATIKSCGIVDGQVKQIVESVLANDGIIFITASHGNAEEMINSQSGEPDNDNNSYPVPFIIVGNKWEGRTGGLQDSPNSDLSLVKPGGKLADVAPTILKVMGIKKPAEMTGENLI